MPSTSTIAPVSENQSESSDKKAPAQDVPKKMKRRIRGFRDLKIQTKMTLPIILTAVIIFAMAATYSYFFNVKTIETVISAHLETAAQSRAAHVGTALEMYEQRARLLTSKTWLRNHLESYLETGDEEYKAKVAEILTDVQLENPKFLHISIINLEGQIIISTNEHLVGKEIPNRDFFIKGKEGYTISDFHYPEHEDGSRLHIAGPLIQDGKLLGVVAVASGGSTVENAVAEYTGLGESGEIYLINKDGYMITPSRFKDDTFLKKKISTLQANLCIEEHISAKLEGEMRELPEVYEGYRGEEVLGMHRYISEMQWCLIAEINESEALEPTRDLLMFSLVRILVVLVIFFIVTSLIARVISKPIKVLHHGTEIIEKGNLDHKVGIDTGDEIGQLSRSFDKMTTAIKQSRADVDKKVGEQTKEIVAQQKETEESRVALERVNASLTGRELKMIELKKEIERLKKESS